jgi:hypothetical protein
MVDPLHMRELGSARAVGAGHRRAVLAEDPGAIGEARVGEDQMTASARELALGRPPWFGCWLRLRLLADLLDQPIQSCVALFLFDEVAQRSALDLFEALEIADWFGCHRATSSSIGSHPRGAVDGALGPVR